jgi:hypothetical protein
MTPSNHEEQRIQVAQALPNMVLSRAITTPNRMVLCAPGTVLSESLIARMALRGIRRLWVRGHPVEAATGKPFSEALAELRERFAYCEDTPLMRDLQATVERVMVPRL